MKISCDLETANARSTAEKHGAAIQHRADAAMKMYAGLDVGGKRTAVCILDDEGKIVWRGIADTHPEMIDAVLRRFKGELTKVGLESGSFTPHLFRSLAAMDYPMVCMDARRAADAIKSRRIKSDKGDAWALAERLRAGSHPSTPSP